MKSKVRTGGWILGIILIVVGLCLTTYALSHGAEPEEPEVLFESDLEGVLGPGTPALLDYLKKSNFLSNACLKFGEVQKDGTMALPLDGGYIYELKQGSVVWDLSTVLSEICGRKVKGFTDVFMYNASGFKTGYFSRMNKRRFGRFKSTNWNEEDYLTMLDEVYEAAIRKGYRPYDGPAKQFLLWYNSIIEKQVKPCEGCE